MRSNTSLLLDCTLRDGGYYTNWNFSSNFFEKYLYTLKSLPITFTEIGYISDIKDQKGPFYHLDNNLIGIAKSKLRKDQKVLAMINFKEIKNSKHLEKLITKYAKYLDGIRFAVGPEKVKNFISIISSIKKSKIGNLKIYLNLMYLSDWHEDTRLTKRILNDIPNLISAVSFVDSHGALEPSQVNNFFTKINNMSKKSFLYGCHFHNNCGLALANAIIAKKNNCSIIDTTFKGMGRGAGNAETELMLACDIEKRKKIKGFELNDFLEDLKKLKDKLDWGSSFAYAFAAKNGYSQASMMDLIQKRRLDPSTAIAVIKETKEDKIKFSNLKKTMINKVKWEIPVIIGGGETQIEYGYFLFNKISKKKCLIFSSLRSLANFSNLNLNLENNKALILTGNEFEKQNFNKLRRILKKNNINFCIVEEKFLSGKLKKLLGKNTIFSNSSATNPLLIAGLFLKKCKSKSIELAFFDGNPKTKKDEIVMNETEVSIKKLEKKGLKINSITQNFFKSKYYNPWVND